MHFRMRPLKGFKSKSLDHLLQFLVDELPAELNERQGQGGPAYEEFVKDLYFVLTSELSEAFNFPDHLPLTGEYLALIADFPRVWHLMRRLTRASRKTHAEHMERSIIALKQDVQRLSIEVLHLNPRPLPRSSRGYQGDNGHTRELAKISLILHVAREYYASLDI